MDEVILALMEWLEELLGTLAHNGVLGDRELESLQERLDEIESNLPAQEW